MFPPNRSPSIKFNKLNTKQHVTMCCNIQHVFLLLSLSAQVTHVLVFDQQLHFSFQCFALGFLFFPHACKNCWWNIPLSYMTQHHRTNKSEKLHILTLRLNTFAKNHKRNSWYHVINCVLKLNQLGQWFWQWLHHAWQFQYIVIMWPLHLWSIILLFGASPQVN